MNWKSLACVEPDHILKISRTEKAPVNAIWVAQELGIGVFTVKSQEPFVKLQWTSYILAPGFFLKEGEASSSILAPGIFLKEGEASSRRNFAVAYALGHFLIHGTEMSESVFNLSGNRRQAFEFAEGLLIPEWLFWPYFQDHMGPEPVAEGVAKHFQVPLGVAQHRMSTILSGCKD